MNFEGSKYYEFIWDIHIINVLIYKRIVIQNVVDQELLHRCALYHAQRRWLISNKYQGHCMS